VSELLDAAIEEIGRVLIGNKDRNTEEVYLKNAIRHIREYDSQPQLDKRQLKMLHDLRANYRCHNNSAEWAIYNFLVEDEFGKIQNNDLFEVLDAFKKWAQEQEGSM